ncbi:Predicted periplasmic ligand-binding sensor domain [Arthrobacter agilis]|nr:Predicted periplasmic ligand-binding sensor domain [Arthrobacter agilis]
MRWSRQDRGIRRYERELVSPIERNHALPSPSPLGASTTPVSPTVVPPSRESERQRLRSLLRTGLLDSPEEERFNHLTREAQTRFGVHTAIISFISEDRQFLKSFVGDLPRNIPRELAFCNTTIGQEETLVVPDMRTDARFRSHPFVVQDPFVRFYAGVPLRGPSGWFVGSLCLVGTSPRDLSAEERGHLRRLAALAEIEVNTGA